MQSLVQANFIISFSIRQIEAILLIHQGARFGLAFPDLEGLFIRVTLVDAMDVSQTVYRNPNMFMAFSQVGPCAGMHKDYFEQRIKELVADKDFMRSFIMKYIIEWGDKFKDEPSLLTEEGLNLKDETELEETEEETQMKENIKSLARIF